MIVFRVGNSAEAQPSIRGGYDVVAGAACLGKMIDVRQSGEFVTLQLPDGSRAGNMRFKGELLTGDVECRGGDAAPLSAEVRNGTMRGRLGDAAFEAKFAREPPSQGARQPMPPRSIAGEYAFAPRSTCLGGTLELEGSETRLELGGGAEGEIEYTDTGALAGHAICRDGTVVRLAGLAMDRDLALTIARGAPLPCGPDAPAGQECVTARRQREFGGTLAAFFIAVAVAMVAARFVGTLAARAGQPRVMGEVTAGILLGPTVFGTIAPEAQRALFPSDVIPFIGVAANLGLIFYMFMVGLELDVSILRGRIGQTIAISNTGVAIPMALGLAVAIPLYGLVGPPDHGFIPFALFMGVSMSITAFPVLARILAERRMLKRPLGVLALASAAVDDVTAWFLIALATAVAIAGSASGVLRTVMLAIAFCAVMVLVVRRVIGRVSMAYDEAGRVPGAWITAIFAGVLLAAYTTEEIGIALIFGAFVMGAIMPRHAGLSEDVTHRMEDFVVLLLLPLFFTYTGLRTDVLLLDRPELVVLTLALLVVAIVCKFGATLLAARVTGLSWRESSVIGALMNTRGLTELIVLNLALEMGVISEALFAALVIMALVTTFMTGPVLKWLDPRNEFGAAVEEELDSEPAARAPERSILVAPQTEAALEQLAALAEPLARSKPTREVILVRLVRPTRGASVRGGLQTDEFMVGEATAQVHRVRERLVAHGVAARGVAFSSADIGEDLVRLAERESVNLLLLDGGRPLLGQKIPRGDVGKALESTPSDVAVLVAREHEVIELGPERRVVVPFGGHEHDWAALELGAWLSAACGAPLKLLGAADYTQEGRDASRLLGTASLMVQRFAGVPAEPILAEPGREGVERAAAGAALLLIGLSDRWRAEGLGSVRSAIARSAPAPILFVRRGIRAGVLAPRDDLTRFTWSSPTLGASPG